MNGNHVTSSRVTARRASLQPQHDHRPDSAYLAQHIRSTAANEGAHDEHYQRAQRFVLEPPLRTTAECVLGDPRTAAKSRRGRHGGAAHRLGKKPAGPPSGYDPSLSLRAGSLLRPLNVRAM
ncbi:hypothetical protein MTO96_000716 [Rhipicephalus appendiculatus]